MTQPAKGRIDMQIVEAAAQWMSRLQSGEATAADHAACEQWRQADPAHELAWRRMALLGQDLRAGLDQMPPSVARKALHVASPGGTAGRVRRVGSVSRRSALKSMAGVGIAASGAWLASEQFSGHGWNTLSALAADYRTGSGERRTIALADGTRVVLNTGTAIDVRFTPALRELVLLAGEIQVTTGHDPAARPFSVTTRNGSITPLGTRFILREGQLSPDGTSDKRDPINVSVLEGAVQIRTRQGSEPFRLDAGQETAFTSTAIDTPSIIHPQASAWLDGMLVAEQMPLGQFIAELARYRAGSLRCDPALAALRVSGAFPLDNTDAVLAILEQTLPVQVRYLTRYWVRVAPR
ncbi:FecR domain-containing protein [Cupriavidus basilensis]